MIVVVLCKATIAGVSLGPAGHPNVIIEVSVSWRSSAASYQRRENGTSKTGRVTSFAWRSA